MKMNNYGLLFYLSEDFTDSDVDSLRQRMSALASTVAWTDTPPHFIDETQDLGTSGEDEPIRTVGGFLQLPPPGVTINRQVERSHLNEVHQLVEFLSDFSATAGCEFELEIGGNYTGDIANGEPDELVTEGLLQAWRRQLDD